ncbi:MAG: hypothetical protein RLZZ111_82 [Planctomycetota bacterium]|jgi:hypothetical protein
MMQRHDGDSAKRRSGRRADLPALAMLALGVLVSAGCGRSGPAVAFVEGTVLLDGQPVAEATVGFSPLAGGLPAVGMTDGDGRFRLSSTGGGRPEAGAVPGEYVVMVSKQVVEHSGAPPTPEEESSAAPTSWPDRGSARPPTQTVRDLVPAAYGQAESSDLRAVVKPGRNTLQFELRSDRSPAR